MNNNINYPFLAGYLQGTLKGLAFDYKFLDLESYDARRAYVQNLIDVAIAEAKKDTNTNHSL